MKPRGQSQTTPLSNKSFGFDILLGQGASKTSAMSLANKDLLNCPTLTPKKNFTISASGFKGSELSLAVSSSVRRFNDWNSRNRRKSQHIWASWICGGHIFSIEFNSICGSCTLETSKIEVLSPVSLKPSPTSLIWRIPYPHFQTRNQTPKVQEERFSRSASCSQETTQLLGPTVGNPVKDADTHRKDVTKDLQYSPPPAMFWLRSVGAELLSVRSLLVDMSCIVMV